MDWVKPLEAWINQWWVYVSWCLEADKQAPICRPFWTWVAIACLGIGAVGLVVLVVKFISYRIKLAAAIKADNARRVIADDEMMRQHRWEGDTVNQDNATPA